MLSGAFQVAVLEKSLLANAGDVRDTGSTTCLGRSPVFLPGQFHR